MQVTFLLGTEGLSLFQNSIDFSVMRLKGFSDIFHLMPSWEPPVMGGSEEQPGEFEQGGLLLQQ